MVNEKKPQFVGFCIPKANSELFCWNIISSEEDEEFFKQPKCITSFVICHLESYCVYVSPEISIYFAKRGWYRMKNLYNNRRHKVNTTNHFVFIGSF